MVTSSWRPRRMQRFWVSAGVGILLLTAGSGAAAQTDSGTSESGSGSSPESAFLLGGKVGGILPLNGLDPFVSGGLDLGWIFAGTDGRIGAMLSVAYTQPGASGSESDARISSGEYTWEITQREFTLQPTFLYRLTMDGDLTPFAGIGPRVYLLETNGKGQANGEVILESNESSTKVGVGVPLGVEYRLGPGGLTGELLAEWGPLDHRMTGDSSLLGVSLLLGYRALL